MTSIEIVYIPEHAMAIHYYVPWCLQMTVADVIHHAKILDNYPELVDFPVGVFSKVVSRDTLVKPGDRIEFYRPLLIDPKEKRRMCAQIKAVKNAKNVNGIPRCNAQPT